MIKIENLKIQEEKEITLPFITVLQGDYFMWVTNGNGKISPVELSSGKTLILHQFNSITDVLQYIQRNEQIVDAKIVIE